MTTNFYFLQDIDFSPDYAHLVDFDNEILQGVYFNSKRVTGHSTDAVYIRDTNNALKVRISKLICEQYPYLTFQNEIGGVSRTYYAFVTKTVYIDQDTTAVYYEIDYWQTYMFDYSIKSAFIDRQHEDRFNADLTPRFNYQKENVDIGSEYIIREKETIRCPSCVPYSSVVDEDITWLEVITTEPLGDRIVSMINQDKKYRTFEIPLPYYVYYLPFSKSPTWFDNLYLWDNVDKTKRFLNSESYSAQFANNSKVVSVRIEPYAPFEFEIILESGKKFIKPISTNLEETYKTILSVNFYFINLTEYKKDFQDLYLKDLSITPIIDESLVRNPAYETKLWTHPYSFYQATNYQSDSLVIKRQYLVDNEIDIKYVKGIGFSSKSKIYCENYLQDDGKEYNSINTSIDDLPLVTDYYLNYLANHKASATTGLALQGISGSVGALFGGTVLSKMVDLPIGVGYAGFWGGVNAFKNIQNELLKQDDLQNTPISQRNNGNNAVFDLTDENIRIKLVLKEITDYYYNKIYDFFYRYGYKCNSFTTELNLRSRYYFNYIKCTDINITGNLNNEIREKIREIFINGATIWHCREENDEPVIFNYNLENAEMSLL